jgi:N-acetylmuramoyl-L-alanine amidase
MGFLLLSFSDARRGAVCVGVGALLCVNAFAATQHAAHHAELSPWDQAIAIRQQFEMEPTGTHTKSEYTAVMDQFRAIYHGKPTDAYAARSVEQVAELLVEQGHEFHDAKCLKDAVGQYTFLAKAYPAYAKGANAKRDALLAEDRAPVATRLEAEAAPIQKVAAPTTKSRRSTVDEEIARAESQTVAQSRTAVPAPVVHDTADDSSEPPHKHALATVTGIRHWSTPTYTRVAIDLGDEVQYQAARVENPDRIYFDLHHTRLAQELVGKSFSITDDGFLTKIRAAQFTNDVTRVVLDVHEVGEYSAFLLPNPYRLIIDIHGKGTQPNVAPSDHQSSEAAPTEEHQWSAPPQKGTENSGLPPMPVTDGSKAFGLPGRNTQNASVAQPRVVIPQKPTQQKPVPNTVVAKDTSTDLASISDEQGRVEANKRPTSQPIVSRSSTRTASKKTTHIAGEPAEVAPPTADGQTSMMRALGLKIGRIVIDAGHGGHDSGTLGAGGIEEKDVVLDVALRLGKLLHDRLGAEVVYTRADDTFIPLETRTAIANKAQADLFISVHANSSQDPSARGVEVYYLNFTSDPDAMSVASRENAVSTQSVHELSDLVKKIALKDKIDESKELATDVDESLYAGIERGNAGLKNRGVKKAPFVVLIGANMPSILAEISFVTNPDDAAKLETPVYRERVAESIYNGVAQYASGINGTKKPKPTESAAR